MKVAGIAALLFHLVLAVETSAQLAASDNFETYVGNPVGAPGGDGDWTANWGANSEFGGGSYLNSLTTLEGAQSLGLFGSGSNSGTSVSRPFPACTQTLFVAASFRGDFNANSVNPPTRRLAFTIRSGNEASHFDNQRLSFFFAAGSTNFQWYDGVDRSTPAVNFTLGHRYDLNCQLNPPDRTYAFSISNRNNGTFFTYSGSWSSGTPGDSIGSVAFFMRGPDVVGNDAFLDEVWVAAPTYSAPVLPGPQIVEGDSWRYFKGTSTPPAQGTNQWFNLPFDDSAWLGPSPSGFGFADCDDNTTLDDMNTYSSVFTRRLFAVADAGLIHHLTLAADYDDGFVAYINGVEVARRNMPAGTPQHSTLASGNHEASRGPGSSSPATEEKEFIPISPSVLRDGTNVIAVSGHNVSLSSSDLSLIVELYTNAALVRGPFIQMPTPGPRATVVWRTAAPMGGAVDFGLDLTYAAGTVSNEALLREQALEMPDLLPGTTYFYRVRSGSEVLASNLQFRTRAATNQSFRFVVIGDHGQGTPAMYAIADRVNERTDFDTLLTVGDNIYGNPSCNTDGAPGWYDPFWFQLYRPTIQRVSAYITLGNHDNDTASGMWSVANFLMPTNAPAPIREKNYSFTFGNAHFAVIDSDPFQNNDTVAMSMITSWLSNDLASASQPWKMVFYHHPPYTSLGSHDDNVRMKSNIVPVMKTYGVQMAFQGHNHHYERINAIDGINYLTSGACGAGLYATSNRKPYSARLVANIHSYSLVDIQNGLLTLEQYDENGLKIDEFRVDIGHPFSIDGLIDNPGWLRASNNLNLYAAIRGHYLYVATQDAGEGNDHFVYIASNQSTQQPANWAKAGTVMTWDTILADENDGAFQGWLDSNQQSLTDFALYKSMSSGLNNNDTNGNGVLEGTLDVAAHYGLWPTQLWFAVAPYGTANGGALVGASQVPAGNGDADLQGNEFLSLNLRTIALDLPVAEAGEAQSVEAGQWAVLNGNNSLAPSGLPLSYAWSKVAGPDVVATNLNHLQPALVLTSNVLTSTPVLLRLVVNDGRFDSDEDLVTINFFPLVDSDGDGLSDVEETTGYDNILTVANPGGQITLPLQNDSDADGVTDGDEALAGTNPNNNASTFKIVDQKTVAGSAIAIDWSTVSGRVYAVHSAADQLTNTWDVLDRFTATSAVSRTSDTNAGTFTRRFYRIEVEY